MSDHSLTPLLPATLDARQLRLVTERARIRRQELWFRYDRAGSTLARVPRGGPLSPADAYVPAFTQAIQPIRWGAVARATVAVKPGFQPLDLLAAGADAVFWSEGAVEKFLVPFCASVAGAGADVVLTDLLGAWNRYEAQGTPGRRLGSEVYALAHMANPLPENEAMDPYRMVGVIFADAGSPEFLQLRTLGDFLDEYAVAPPKPVRGVRGRGKPGPGAQGVTASAFQLRRVAEWAAGVRDEKLLFVIDHDVPGGRITAQPLADLFPVGEHLTLIPAYTPAVRPDRRRMGEFLFGTDTRVTDLMTQEPEIDAVFFSDGAVEQFPIPYYASVAAADASSELEVMMGIYGQPEVLGLTHLPKSDYATESELTISEHCGVLHLAGEEEAPEVCHTVLTELSEGLRAAPV